MAFHSRYTKDGASKRICPFMNKRNINSMWSVPQPEPVYCMTEMCMAWMIEPNDMGYCLRLRN